MESQKCWVWGKPNHTHTPWQKRCECGSSVSIKGRHRRKTVGEAGFMVPVSQKGKLRFHKMSGSVWTPTHSST